MRATVYEHPYDRNALASLKGMPGLEILIRKFNDYSIERVLRIQYTGSNLRINGDTFPEILDLVKNAASILDIGQLPDLYVQEGAGINAFTAGIDHPLIVLNSACIDHLSPDELLFVIGHELGHIKSQHVLYHQIGQAMHYVAEVVGSVTLGISDLIYNALEVAFRNWARMSELTADRAGLLACQDVNVANSTLAKIAGLPHKFYDRFNVDDLVAQAREFKGYDLHILDKLIKVLSIMDQSHPWTVLRASELYEWESSNAYSRVLGDPASGGDALTAPRYCDSCGRKLSGDEAFCGACGRRLPTTDLSS